MEENDYTDTERWGLVKSVYHWTHVEITLGDRKDILKLRSLLPECQGKSMQEVLKEFGGMKTYVREQAPRKFGNDLVEAARAKGLECTAKEGEDVEWIPFNLALGDLAELTQKESRRAVSIMRKNGNPIVDTIE